MKVKITTDNPTMTDYVIEIGRQMPYIPAGVRCVVTTVKIEEEPIKNPESKIETTKPVI